MDPIAPSTTPSCYLSSDRFDLLISAATLTPMRLLYATNFFLLFALFVEKLRAKRFLPFFFIRFLIAVNIVLLLIVPTAGVSQIWKEDLVPDCLFNTKHYRVRLSVHTPPPLGHPVWPEAQPARPEA